MFHLKVFTTYAIAVNRNILGDRRWKLDQVLRMLKVN